MTARIGPADRLAIERYLHLLFDAAASHALIEVRFRIKAGMGRSFHPVTELGELTAVIAEHAERRDVFVGVVPRARRAGGRGDVVEQVGVVWADCDGPEAVAAVAGFEPGASMIVASGSGMNCHAYWLLSRPIEMMPVEQLNRRLALALGADVRSSDGARILRPAGSASWKSLPPTPVRLVKVEPSARVDSDALEARLPAASPGTLGDGKDRGRVRGQDPLLEIQPREYVEALTGDSVGRDGKVRCPFHDDRSPSLHVFAEPERGWFCFGCGAGGSVYDFAARLWSSGHSGSGGGRALRGREFVEVRERLLAIFFGDLAAASRDRA